MIKFTSTSDYDWDIEPVSIITDSKQLVKRAGVKDQLQFERTPNQTDLHIIALGAYEGYGDNRNSDRFHAKDCRDRHQTFKQANRAVHRHHKNKKADPKYGNIKASAYNEKMKRVELIIGLDNDKCADILDEQEKKGSTNWSMACKIPFDICSWCGTKAKVEKERCDCIKNNLGEINKDGEKCAMVNVEPTWFEQSYVHRPACRVGMSLKLASDERIKPVSTSEYLKLYPDFEMPEEELYISKKAEDKRNILRKLSEMEKHLDAVSVKPAKTPKDAYLHRQGRLKKSPSMSDKDMDQLRQHDPHKAFRAMADKGIVLNPEEFIKYLFGDKADSKLTEGMKSHLPHIFSKMEDGNPAETVNNEKFEPSNSDIMPKELKNIVSRLFEDHSMFSDPAVNRVMKITITMGCVGDKNEKLLKADKEPTKNKTDEKMAEYYGAYKIAALNYLNDIGKLDDETMYNVLIQNR